jgi:hypothetical protein
LNLSDEDIERREKAAQELAQAANERTPDSQSWGLFSYGDGPPAAGGGVGIFLWFSSEAELLDFVALHLLFSEPGPTGVLVEPRLVAVGEIIDKLRIGELERGPARLALNNSLKCFSQIEWWGTRSNLFSADAEFPRRVRARFRDDWGKPDSTGQAITEEEEKDFLQYLETYGL